MNVEIGNPGLNWLLVFLPILLSLSIYNGWARQRAFDFFGAKTSRRNVGGSVFSEFLLLAGFGLLVLACMDIRWGKTTREVPQKGLEVVFALDVSRSMLAEDAKPNRLIRAKQQIKDMVDEMAGDRVGLVAFAGEAVQSVPLTNHYDDFRQKLDEVGPHSVSKGGSQLGTAIKSAADTFISKTNEHRTIVLITDGEDQESQPLELAKALHSENGLRIFTVGLGDMDQGSRIPDDNARNKKYVEHDGQQVWTKLNGSILRKIATETNAAYIPAGTKRVDMAEVYHNYIANIEKSEFETAKINSYVPRFQWFAVPAFICFMLNVWTSTRKTSRDRQWANLLTPRNSETESSQRSSSATVSKVATIALVLMPSSLLAQSSHQSVASSINAANELVRSNENSEAIDAFNQIIVGNDSNFRDELNYNLASAHYRNSDLEAAIALFEETAKSTNNNIASDSRFNLGNCRYAMALPLVEQNAEAAIIELQRAITHYRSALRLDRLRSDARENIERAGKLIEQLQNKRQDQQEQNQPQDSDTEEGDPKDQQQLDQDKEQNQDDSSDSNEEQNKQPSESKPKDSDQLKDDSQQAAQDSESTPEQGEQSKNDTEPSSDQSQSTESESSQSQQNAESQQVQSHDNSHGSEESGNQETDSNKTQPEQPNDGKEPPKGNVSAANEQANDKTNPAGSAGVASGLEQDSGMMSKQEALKLLQAVRDRDMLRRLKQRQRQSQRRIKVDKDW